MRKTALCTLILVCLLFVCAFSGCEGEPYTEDAVVGFGENKSTETAEEVISETIAQTDLTTEQTTAKTTAKTTEKTTAKTTEQTTQTTKSATGSEATVWIPQSGSKYHSNSSCSNMKNPTQIAKSVAINRGYTACKKCY